MSNRSVERGATKQIRGSDTPQPRSLLDEIVSEHERNVQRGNDALNKSMFDRMVDGSPKSEDVFKRSPLSDPLKFGRTTVTVLRFGRIVRSATFYGRALDFAMLAWEMYQDLKPVPLPANPDPSPLDLLNKFWNVDPNWPPPYGSPYDRTFRYTKNQTTSGSAQANPDNASDGVVLPAADWSGVLVGDGVYPVIAGDFAPFGEPFGTYYAQQGFAIRTDDSLDPFEDGWTYDIDFNPWPELNPNYMRRAKSDPSRKFVSKPETPPEEQPLVATARVMQPGYAPRFEKPAGRKPPGRRERQGKWLSPEKRFMIGLFKMLDFVSESCEIVDAMFEALPQYVQRRWKGKAQRWYEKDAEGSRAKEGSRGLLDSAGQYGIDGCEWKLQALYHNLTTLDPDKAFNNLANNIIQDFIHGKIHKNTPVNTGRAIDPALKAVEDWMRANVYW